MSDFQLVRYSDWLKWTFPNFNLNREWIGWTGAVGSSQRWVNLTMFDFHCKECYLMLVVNIKHHCKQLSQLTGTAIITLSPICFAGGGIRHEKCSNYLTAHTHQFAKEWKKEILLNAQCHKDNLL